MNRITAFICISIASVFIFAADASAHVLVSDTGGTSGGILHVMPDDDPIAGAQTDIYFDTKNSTFGEINDGTLKVTDSTGVTIEVPLKVTNGSISALYTFPSRGVYKLSFELRHGDRTVTYMHDQRISRGVESVAGSTPRYAWAESVLWISGGAMSLLLLLAAARIKKIKSQSR